MKFVKLTNNLFAHRKDRTYNPFEGHIAVNELPHSLLQAARKVTLPTFKPNAFRMS